MNFIKCSRVIKYYSSFDFSFNCLKIIVSSWVIQKQAVGWIWLIPGLHRFTTTLAIVTDVILKRSDRNQSMFVSGARQGLTQKSQQIPFEGYSSVLCLTVGVDYTSEYIYQN